MKTYAEKLKDPRWQRKRLEVMNRDGFACTECKAEDKTLHVHHKEYRTGAEPWDYPDENFQTLCEDCHGKEHDIDTEPRKKRLNGLIVLMIQISARDANARRHLLLSNVDSTGIQCPECEELPLIKILIILLRKYSKEVEMVASDFPDEMRDLFCQAMAEPSVFPDFFNDDVLDQICSQFRGLILRRRDQAAKEALKKPGLSVAEMTEILMECKQISSELRDANGLRMDFSEDLPAPTYREIPTPQKRHRERF